MDVANERDVVEDLLVLDPGVGSGTFLIEGANRLDAAGIERFWERLTGFDISPQAIGIAQTNLYLAVLARLDRVEAEEVGTLQLYPTDALDPRNGARLKSIMPLLADESTKAFIQHRIELSETVKQQSHFSLVIGNPPYRNNSNQTLAQVAERFPMLLRSSRDNARARKRNIRDDYAWFFAAADHYIADRGMIAFVVSDSFCYASSYRFFREDLLRRYRVRQLVNLGVSVFRDVGPRTQFVIVVLERRGEDLQRADDAEPIPYIDLRPLASGSAEFGTAADPRLMALDAGQLPNPVDHLPTRERGFVFFPALDVVASVERFPNVLHGDSARRVFLKKWPGLITAFDQLFRANTAEDLEAKLRGFFNAVRLEDEQERERALDRLAAVIGATSEKNRGRLSLMARQAADAGLAFTPSKIRRVVTGSVPNEVAWYPDERLRSWIYYEPQLRVPRNVHEGRDPGYGTMSQWRDEESHTIGPKLVFTTSTNPEYGLKALVVPADWMVKSHGGESQQFHYTGLENPLRPPNLSGPNNLGDDAQVFIAALTSSGREPEDFLFYVAGIYNSQVAEDFLAGGGGNVMHIPLELGIVTSGMAGTIIDTARELRDLHWLSVETQEGIDADLAETLLGREKLIVLGMVEQSGSGGRFRQRRTWRFGPNSDALIEERISVLRPQLDDAVDMMFRS
jgi:methylase of polypeptide subunit release factors